MDTLVKLRVWAALVWLCLTVAVAAECDCFYPYGTDQVQVEYKFGTKFFGIDGTGHKEWDKVDIFGYEGYPDGGYIEYDSIQIQYWKGAGINITANPDYRIFYMAADNDTVLSRATNDVVSAFGDTTFKSTKVDILTIANFTYVGGDASSEMNTIQIVQAIDEISQKVYIQINVDIEWWNATGFPVLGIARLNPRKIRGNANESITYHIPGSGTSRIQSILSTGNTGVSGRWMFTPSCTLCGTPYALGIPNGYLSIGSISRVGESQYISFCHPGYTGQMCETRIDYCASSPCDNGNCTNVGIDSPCIVGNCSDGITSFTCVCNPGYTGNLCDKNIDECSANTCLHGCCQDLVNNYTCECHPGWTGTHCDVNIDDCIPDICINGNCTDLDNGYNCSCDDGFSGITCEINIDDCALSPCVNNGICIDNVGYFNCSCDAGFSGRLCEVNLNDCSTSPCVHGVCKDGIDTYTCQCFPGFTGTNCESDIHECSDNPCHNGQCHDETRNYRCSCNPGFTGILCDQDIDECNSNPCVHGSCDSSGGPNNYTCSCSTGYSGTNCDINIDECSENPCTNGTCMDRVNGFECLFCGVCDDKLCTIPKDYCIGNTLCQNGGSCVSVGLPLEFYCECVDGVYGRFCENDTRPSTGTYSEWSGYGACTKTCDSGLQKRTRQCLREPCDGCTYENRLCNVKRCEEVDTEINHSLLISTSKGLTEVVEEEHELKKDVAQSMNSYCSSNCVECCDAGGISVVSNIVISAFAEDDVVLVKGYPSEANSNTVHIRFFVRLSQSFVSACASQAGNNNLVRKKSSNLQTSSTPRTIPVAIVRKAVGGTIGQVLEDLCCYNVVTNTTEISTSAWGAILGVSVTLTLIILILFFVVFMPWCQRKRSAFSPGKQQ